jgi:hypothetical protein
MYLAQRDPHSDELTTPGWLSADSTSAAIGQPLFAAKHARSRAIPEMAVVTALIRAPILAAARALRYGHSSTLPATTACRHRTGTGWPSARLCLPKRPPRPSEQQQQHRWSPITTGTARALWICAATSLTELYDRAVTYGQCHRRVSVSPVCNVSACLSFST